MKLFTFSLVTAISLTLSQGALAAVETLTFKNARGSILKLQFSGKDTVRGTFTTAVASKECQQAIGKERPVIGYVAKNAITLSVDYPDCGSVVTFIGNIENNQQLIDTTSIVAHQSTHIAKEGPGARFIGHDLFKRV